MHAPDVTIKIAEPSDVPGMVRLFSACMPNSLWSQAGERFANTYFDVYAARPAALAVIAVANGEVMGGCVGAARLDRYQYRFYRENCLRLLAAAARDAFDDRRVLLPILRRVIKQGSLLPARIVGRATSYIGARNGSPTPLPDPDGTCHMTLFCVAPEARGQRLGTRMLEAFMKQMAAEGREWCLAEADADNVASQIAQQRAGLKPVNSTREHMILLGRTTLVERAPERR